MQQIEVDPVGAQPPEAALAGSNDAAARSVVRIDLADDEEIIAQPFDGAGDHLLGTTAAIHLGGVDQRHAEFDPEAHRRRLFRDPAAILAHMPCPLAEGRHALAAGQCHGL